MYACTNCDWEGEKEETLTPQEGDHRCPECIAGVAPAHEVEEEDDDVDDDVDPDGFNWNPTMRAGEGGPVIE